MPWHWDPGLPPDGAPEAWHGRGDPPLAVLWLAAHNSLSPHGFVTAIALTATLLAVPLLMLHRSPAFWGMLPFALAVLAGLWMALQRSWRDHDVRERLAIWTDIVRLEHRPGRGSARHWQAQTFWATAHLFPERDGLPCYITLTGGADGREVELGRFLTGAERGSLYPELSRALDRAGHCLRPA